MQTPLQTGKHRTHHVTLKRCPTHITGIYTVREFLQGIFSRSGLPKSLMSHAVIMAKKNKKAQPTRAECRRASFVVNWQAEQAVYAASCARQPAKGTPANMSCLEGCSCCCWSCHSTSCGSNGVVQKQAKIYIPDNISSGTRLRGMRAQHKVTEHSKVTKSKTVTHR